MMEVMEVMEVGTVISCTLALLSTLSTSALFLLLASFLASISPVKRNIFTHFDSLFILVALGRVWLQVNRVSFY